MFTPGTVVLSGDVSVHHDGDQHWAIILDIRGDDCEALFFTSNPDWAERSRRATRDEIAMAGFITTRPTYLAYVMRPIWDFTPLGIRFSRHRIEALIQEFRPAQKIQQVEGGTL